MDQLVILSYQDFLELRRDLSALQAAFTKTLAELRKFDRLFTVAHLMLDGQSGDTKPLKGLRHAEIQKNYGVLARLQDQLSVLDNMLHHAEHQFVGDRSAGKAAEQMKDLRTSITAELEKAFGAAERLARNVIPPPFKNWSVRLTKDVEAKLGSTTPIVRTLAAVIDRAIHYVTYAHFNNVSDKDGFVYNDYYVILTMVPGDGKPSYYSSASTQFWLPGKYRLENSVASFADLRKQVLDQLSKDKFKAQS